MKLEILSLIISIVGGLAAIGYFLDKWNKKRRQRRFAERRILQTSARSTSFRWLTEDFRGYAIDLFSYLENDQDGEGLHLGEFGRGHRPDEEDRYQSVKTQIDLKPRLYLSGLPCHVLIKYRNNLPSNPMLELVEKGVLELFEDSWINANVGARPNISPVDPKRDGRAVSYRHSIRGAQILLMVGKLEIVRHVLGRMLDRSLSMQTDGGGWRQGNIDTLQGPDLWGSAYAADFLHTCVERAEDLLLDKKTVERARISIDKTFNWLHSEWDSCGWPYGEIASEENAPLLLPELVAAGLVYRPTLVREVLLRFESYHDLTLQPSSFFLTKNSIVGPCAAAARLAYNFFSTREFGTDSSSKWRPLRDYSLQHLGTGFNCVEAAMLLEMILHEHSPSA
jgi:hypothetical protein